MKPASDPKTRCEFLLGPLGFARCLSSDYHRAEAIGGVGSSAAAFLTMAAEGVSYGLEAAATPVLLKASQWIKLAIMNQEVPSHYFLYATESTRYQTLAGCNWLLHGAHDRANLERAVEYRERYFQHSTESARDKVSVGLSLPVYVEAGAYELGLMRFDATPGLKPPKSLATLRGEAVMSYVWARWRLGLEFDEAEVIAAAKKFLNRNMGQWLRAHFLRTAQWLKIIYWREGTAGLSPKETLLKCFDHL